MISIEQDRKSALIAVILHSYNPSLSYNPQIVVSACGSSIARHIFLNLSIIFSVFPVTRLS